MNILHVINNITIFSFFFGSGGGFEPKPPLSLHMYAAESAKGQANDDQNCTITFLFLIF
jgi:hypothetical protein